MQHMLKKKKRKKSKNPKNQKKRKSTQKRKDNELRECGAWRGGGFTRSCIHTQVWVFIRFTGRKNSFYKREWAEKH